MNNCIIFGIKDKMFNGKNVNKFYNWREIAKINTLEENLKLLRNEIKQLRDSQESQEKKIDDLKNLFINFAQQYEINNKKIFDKLNQMNTEPNKNNLNNSSKSCNMLKKKRKHN